MSKLQTSVISTKSTCATAVVAVGVITISIIAIHSGSITAIFVCIYIVEIMWIVIVNWTCVHT